MTLLTENQLAAVRRKVEKGMVTPVTIFRRTDGAVDAQNDYGDDILTYPETSESRRTTVKGWLFHDQKVRQDVDTGAVVTTSTLELRLPVGTDIATGDGVEIDGEQYTVQETHAENTYKPFLGVSLRKRE